jgi:tRNA (guanine37-N1)-methyltransferase
MQIDVVTLFPDLVKSVIAYGVTGRAAEAGLLELRTWNPRDYATDNHHTVDDRPYGGGPGMVMKVTPLQDAISAARAVSELPAKVMLLSPQGRRLDQAAVNDLALRPRMILVAGRYEGIDERLVDLEIDEEWSLGDYVLSGGELAAMVMVDAVTRMLPGALGDAESAQQESHMRGLLDHPHYTRPEQLRGLDVPPVLMGGNHAEIARWREKQALGRTWLRRRDMLAQVTLSEQQQALLDEFIRERSAGTDSAD